MNEQQILELIEYLKTMGEMAVSKGFELALLEVQVRLIQNSFASVIAASLIVLSVVFIKRIANKKWGAYNQTDKELAYTGAGVLLGISAIWLATELSVVTGYLLNPEYRAIKLLLEALRQ